VRARDFATFRQGFAEWPALPLNVVYADTHGTIGWQLAGQLPEREAGLGLVPTPATRPGAGWKDELVPFDQMPHFTDPDSGFITTANNPTTMREPASPWLGADYIDGYRAAVIADELTRREKWDVPACQALQMNVRSLPWEELRELVLGLAPTEEDARLGLDLLRGWDGQVSVDSSAAAVFEIFTAELIQRVARAKAPKSWEHAIGGPGPGPLNHSLFADRRVGHLVRLLRTRPQGWFAQGWEKEMTEALTATVRRLRQVKRLSKAFNLGPVPCPGDFNTVMQAGTFPRTPTAQTHNFPNMRAVFDTAAWKNSRFVLAGGQSGNPCSPHYDDQFPLWQKGKAIPIAWEPGEVILAAVASLRLVPGVVR
jgi:penicillin amidase